MDAEITLTISAGPLAGKKFVFDAHDTFIFGRDGACHHSIPDDPYISGRHFLIEVNPPECQLKDLGSKNGTRVNGVRSGQRLRGETPEQAARRAQAVPLKEGDVITAGLTEFRVAVKAALEPTPAARKTATMGAKEDAAAGFMTNFLAGIAQNIGPDRLPEFPGFKTEKRLKVGGMGEVFLARASVGDRKVVIKIIKPQGTKASKKQITLFWREMEVTQNLRHKNIVEFVKSGLADDVFFFVMEYCSEGSFADLARKSGGTLSVKAAIPPFLQALEGLNFAHGKEVVHRDLKPDNILLAGDGGGLVAKVADFGLAKNFALAGLSGFTASGQGGAGTLQFMPKEQIEKFRDARPVSDVFAMGATLYNLLSGEFVYEADGAQLVDEILGGRVVSIRKRGVDLPEPLLAVIDRATAPEASQRYQTVAEFRDALLKAGPV